MAENKKNKIKVIQVLPMLKNISFFLNTEIKKK